MDEHRREIESLSQRILDYQEVATPAAIEAAEDIREDTEPELTDLTRSDAFEHHLNEFLQQERKRLNEGKRDDPLCDCDRPTCPVKRAELPPSIKEYDDLLEGIRNYQRDHVGNAQGLSGARDAFIERCASVKSTLRRALAAIQMDEHDESEEEAVEA